MKIVIILDAALPRGVMANASAALAMSCSVKNPGLVGDDVLDAGAGVHPGLLMKPVAVLSSDRGGLKTLRERALSTGVSVIGFTEIARRAGSYAEYIENMSETDPHDLEYLGLCIFGEKAKVAGLTGALPLVK